MQMTLQPAFILHSRAYRETSLLLDVFSKQDGRISLIARGVRTNRSKLRPILQPFVPLLISWQGKSELMMLTSAESESAPLQLQKECLFSGFYLNELLVRVLQKNDPHPALYTIYSDTLLELQSGQLHQSTLRLFEKKLLEELGYGLQLQQDFSTGDALIPEQFYQFYPERGFKRSLLGEKEGLQFKGQYLLALANEELKDNNGNDNHEAMRDIKSLMRIALASLLGLHALQARKLFREVSHDSNTIFTEPNRVIAFR